MVLRMCETFDRIFKLITNIFYPLWSNSKSKINRSKVILGKLAVSRGMFVKYFRPTNVFVSDEFHADHKTVTRLR